jgi:hypothetical protein
MDRRDFMVASLALLATAWPVAVAHARLRGKRRKSLPAEPGDIFLDISGAYGEGAFVVGALTGLDYAACQTEAMRLRESTRFRCALGYASRNRYKLPYAKGLIEAWLAGKNLRIDILTRRDTSARASGNDVHASLEREVDIVADLLGSVPALASGRHRLVTQRHFQGLLQDEFEEKLLRREPRLGSVLRIRSARSDLAQLLDLVVGSVRADQGKIPKPARNKVKRELNALLAARLGVENLRQPVSSARCTLAFA